MAPRAIGGGNLPSERRQPPGGGHSDGNGQAQKDSGPKAAREGGQAAGSGLASRRRGPRSGNDARSRSRPSLSPWAFMRV